MSTQDNLSKDLGGHAISADSDINAFESIHFVPHFEYSQKKPKNKESKIASKASFPAFRLDSLFYDRKDRHFFFFRFLGWTWQATFGIVARNLNKFREQSDNPWGEWLDKKINTKLPIPVRSELLFDPNDNIDRDAQARIIISIGEAISFSALTIAQLGWEGPFIKEHFAGIVAAEKGKDPGQVTLRDIFKSKNRMVRSYMDRFVLQNIMRGVMDLTFLKSLFWGIMANIGLITFEKAALTDKIAVDNLRKMIDKVQEFNLGELGRERVMDQLTEAVQQINHDHSSAPLSAEQLKNLQPAIRLVADAILQKKIGINEVGYILGETGKNQILFPDDPELTMRKLHEVFEKGLLGIAEERAGKEFTHWRKRHGVPKTAVPMVDLVETPPQEQPPPGMEGPPTVAFGKRELAKREEAQLAQGLRATG